MKHTAKIIPIVLALVLCFLTFSFAVSAENTDETTGTEATVSPTDTTEAPVTDPPAETEPVTEPEPATEPYTSPETDPTAAYEPPTEEYIVQTEETIPLPTDAPDYYPESNAVASQNIETINVDEYTDTNTLTDEDWEQIRLSLAQNSDDGTGDDFSFIKNNSATTNNGHWIIIVGVLLIICAAVCIAAFVMLSKKAAFIKGQIRQNELKTRTARKRDDYGDSYSSRRTPNRYK